MITHAVCWRPEFGGRLIEEHDNGPDAFNQAVNLARYYGFPCADVCEVSHGPKGTYWVNLRLYPLGFFDPAYAQARAERRKAIEDQRLANQENDRTRYEEAIKHRPWWRRLF